MKDSNCGYCQGGELLAKFGIQICDLDVSHLADMVFICHNAPSRLALLFEQYQLAYIQITDLNAKPKTRMSGAARSR